MSRTKTPKTSLDHSGFAAKTNIKTVDEIFEEEPASGNSLPPKLKIVLAEVKFKRLFVKCKEPVLNPRPQEIGELPCVKPMNFIPLDAVPQHTLDHYSHTDDTDDYENDGGGDEVDNETGNFTNGMMGAAEVLRNNRGLSKKEMYLQLSHDPNADIYVCKKKGATLVCCADNPICTTCRCKKRFLAEPNVATA